MLRLIPFFFPPAQPWMCNIRKSPVATIKIPWITMMWMNESLHRQHGKDFVFWWSRLAHSETEPGFSTWHTCYLHFLTSLKCTHVCTLVLVLSTMIDGFMVQICGEMTNPYWSEMPSHSLMGTNCFLRAHTHCVPSLLHFSPAGSITLAIGKWRTNP